MLYEVGLAEEQMNTPPKAHTPVIPHPSTTDSLPTLSFSSKKIHSVKAHNSILSIVKQQTEEIRSLRAENTKLRGTLHSAGREELVIKRLSWNLREKEQQIQSLERALAAAQGSTRVSSIIDIGAFYETHPPQRVWKDPSPQLSQKFLEILNKTRELLISTNRRLAI